MTRYIIACIIFAYAAAAPVFSRTENTDTTSQVTIMSGLRAVDCPENEAAAVTDKTRSLLPGIPYLRLVSGEEMKPALEKAGVAGDCRDLGCAVTRGRIIRGHRAIIGSVKKVVTDREERSEAPGKDRYLIKIITETRYVITLELINVRSGAVIAVLEEKTEKEDTDPAVGRLIERLAAYYGPRGVKDEKEKIIDGEKVKPRFGVSLYFSTLVPVDAFGSTAKAGLGMLAEFSAAHLLFRNSALRIQLGYHNLLVTEESIYAMHLLTVTALLGYTFNLPRDFALTPLAGGGYIFNFVNGDNRPVHYNNVFQNSWSTYYNPFIAVRLELDYSLPRGFHLVFTPGYALMFEKKKTGSIFTIDIGARYLF